MMHTTHAGAVVFLAALLAAPAAVQAGETQSGIAVRGDWRIEVRNPDGTTATVREFRNVYVGANNVVPKVLARAVTAGAWVVTLGGLTNDSKPCNSSDGPSECAIVDPNYPVAAGPDVSKNLSVTTPSQAILLTGSHVASRNGSIGIVSTLLRTCPNTATPLACTLGDASNPMTNHVFAPSDAIPVQNGQQILVNVTISFAAAP
jgi:hypothetical protein